ncbi:MAG: hypothetical protein J6R88_00075 [Clostridia bacterium]|nr:hypothetical protein [Clostridia bacterium]
METKKIKVIVSQRQTKDGKKFNAYETLDKKGNKMTLKFTQAVKDLPERTCYANVNVDDMNVDRRKEYPVVWVKAVDSYEELAEVSAENNKKVIDELFD